MPIIGEIYEITVTDMGREGQGIGHIDGLAVFVAGTLPGDKVSVRLEAMKKSYAKGRLIQTLEPSPDRVMPRCPVAEQCGGCTLQALSYEAQLGWKTRMVREQLARIGGFRDIPVQPAIGMAEPYHYRNKAHFYIADDKGISRIGLFAPKSHQIVPVADCCIQHPANQAVNQCIQTYMDTYGVSAYDPDKHSGLIRGVVTRVAAETGRLMICVIINGRRLPHSDVLTAMLQNIPGIAGVACNINRKRTTEVFGPETVTLWGSERLADTINGIRFAISPTSFFQVNPIQTKMIYETALAYAGLTGHETVIDAYCGIGAISLFLAQKAAHVYGIEYLPEAVEDAKANAQSNGISNVTFFAGEAERVLPRLYEEEGIRPDVVVIDPPRKGCHPRLLQTLLAMEPERIVYVSCDPATMARDMKQLCAEKYTVRNVQPIDAFPHTTHVETVALLSRAMS